MKLIIANGVFCFHCITMCTSGKIEGMKRAYIEITNRCNLSCAFCMKHERPYMDMTVDQFEHCVNEVIPFTDYLYLHVQGEPLLHPAIDELLSLTDEKKCHVQLVTNASLLHDHMDLYRHSSLRKISFSLQSIEYQNTQPEQLISDILTFYALAASQGIHCEIRFWRDDQTCMSKTQQCLDLLHARFPFEQTSRRNSLKLADHLYLSYGNSFSWPDLKEEKESMNGTCRATDQIAILSNGTVVPCCLDCKGIIALGNIFTTSLSDILSSSRYRAMMDGFHQHRIVEPLCQKCTYRHRFR